MLDRLVAWPHFAPCGARLLDDFAHPFFDLGQIFRREGLIAGEVVIEAVLDRRADGHLSARIKLLHRLGQKMRRVMADQFQRLVILLGDDADMGVLLDGPEQVPFLAVHFQNQGRLGQARTDGLGDLGPGHASGEIQGLAVGQGDGDLGPGQGKLPEKRNTGVLWT